jgi:hypothetical protein
MIPALTSVILLNIMLAGRMLNRFGKVREPCDNARVTSLIEYLRTWKRSICRWRALYKLSILL